MKNVSLRTIFKVLRIVIIIAGIFAILELGSSIYTLIFANIKGIDNETVSETMKNLKVETYNQLVNNLVCSMVNSVSMIFFSVFGFLYIKKCINEEEVYSKNVSNYLWKLVIFSLIACIISFVGVEIVLLITKESYDNGFSSLLFITVLFIIIRIIINEIINKYQKKEEVINEEQN